MGNKGNQLILLFWKNYLIQKRKVLLTVFEIGIPTCLALILILIRLRVMRSWTENTEWPQCSEWNHLNSALPQKLAYAPQNQRVDSIMHNVEQMINLTEVTPQSNANDLEEFLTSHNSEYLAGVVFDDSSFTNNGMFSEDISYTLRFSSSPRNAGNQTRHLNPFLDDTNWKTQLMFPIFQRIGPREGSWSCGGDPGYCREGFLVIQYAINMAILGNLTQTNYTELILNTEINLQRFPYPAYNDDPFILVIQQQFPFILMLSFILVKLSIVKDVVHEKERKLKESMKMMGLNNWLHWMAWFVKSLAFLLITISIMTLLFCVNTSKGPIIGKTHPSIVFMFLLVYAISTISLSFAVSVFFSKANSGAAAGGILFFVTYMPFWFLQPRYQTLTWGQKILSSLISNVAMAYGGQVIGMFEGTGEGVQWNNINRGASVDDSFTMLNCIIMLLADSVIYVLIAWYVEAVFPGEYGVPQKWCFPFMRSYWCGTKPDEQVLEYKMASVGQNPQYFEKDPVGIRAGIQIRNLRKEFRIGGKQKVAVQGMTLNMYEGQITALLGHNGAGKTTTMSMLTGFLPCTSGTAKVNGYDIRDNIASVRSSLGLCPQHDVLFDSLTVEEHLVFFAKLKGCRSSTVNSEVTNMLCLIDLENKQHKQVHTLSGGMKRKLSVGIALIGGSKVVILDEPSSGLDPNARRHIWTVLQKNRTNRTILLSTHFMDEADVLGDRIAIMADGVVKCCGSSLFLKDKYGAGYHLTIVKRLIECDFNKITGVVRKHIPKAKQESNVGMELSYFLPSDMSHTFAALFCEIDDRKTELEIASYGISETTMEEVFLKVGEDSNEIKETENVMKCDDMNITDVNGSYEAGENTPLCQGLNNTSYTDERRDIQTATFANNFDKNVGVTLFWQQFYGMFIKRVLHTLRNKLVTITQLSVPLFFTLVAMIVIKTFPGPTDSPPLELITSKLGDNSVVYALMSNESLVEGFGHVYASQFSMDPDTGTVLVNNQTGSVGKPNIMKYLLDLGKDDIGTYNRKYLIGAVVDSTNDGKLNITGLFNNQAYHTPAISIAMVTNALIKLLTNNSKMSLRVTNYPLERNVNQKAQDEMTSGTTGFMLAVFISFGLSFLASTFALFLIKERVTKAKHVQLSSGVNLFTFWSATFAWDLINYLVLVICLLVAIRATSVVEAYFVDYNIMHIGLLFLLYGFAMLPFMYLLSFLFTIPVTGYVCLCIFKIFSGIATILAVGILATPTFDLIDLSVGLEWAFLVFLPNYCLAQGLEDYFSNYEFTKLCDQVKMNIAICEFYPNVCCGDITGYCGKDTCLDINRNALGWKSNGIGRMLVFLIVQSIMYFTILLVIESQLVHGLLQCCIKNCRRSHKYAEILSDELMNVPEDEDIAKERARLVNMDLNDLFSSENLIISELTKYYGSHLAVNHISVGISAGECFGLLGINGAGKTSTFKMLTGDELISSGNAYLGAHNVITQIAQVRQNFGYCPQFDALIDQMTGRETLYMYARLRGIHNSKIPAVVDELLDAVLLVKHADKLVQAYSGGNKRKLSTAIALVGNPQVIFLDEPTTGMDPKARRCLWDTLCSIRASGQTLVLTSHSMEECEALCTRLAVMVNGEFKCLGSPQHLKNKFGEGYTLVARVQSPADGSVPDSIAFRTFIEERFPSSILKDIHQGYVNYHINDRTLKLAEIFDTMEKAKHTFDIETYSVSQTTLEQLFINFAKAQTAPIESADRCCKLFC